MPEQHLFVHAVRRSVTAEKVVRDVAKVTAHGVLCAVGVAVGIAVWQSVRERRFA